MENKIEIDNEISQMVLTPNIKENLINLNNLLYNYKGKKSKIELPILIMIKDLDITDVNKIEKVISKMLATYKVFDNKIISLDDTYRKRLLTKIENNKAFKFEIDKLILEEENLYYLFDTFEKVIDSSSPLLIIESFTNIDEELETHGIKNRIDFIFSNKGNSLNIADTLISRYKLGNIKIDLDVAQFEEIIKTNIDSKQFETEELCIQHTYTKSIKSFLTSNRKKLTIEDIPIFENLKLSEPEIEPDNDEDIFKNLVGLANIKDEINKLVKFAIFNKNAIEKNKSISKANLNIAFLGNPGTGKTTVARLLAKAFFQNNIIEKNEVIEIVPNDLMGEYVGHTKCKTRKILEKAVGGILFIDEAYQIKSDGYRNGNPFMKEALIEILKYMENPDNIIIFAGYKNEIEEMINSNPGIKSRIANRFEFEDYNVDELSKLLFDDLKNYDLTLDDSAKEKVINHIKEAKTSYEFGNCRYIKNLASKIIKNHSYISDKKIIDERSIPAIETSEFGFGGA